VRRPQRRVAPLRVEQLAEIVARLDGSIKDTRDRALLLVGFAGALRRSELTAAECQDVEWRPQGIVLTLPRSKTDQEGQGRAVAIPYGSAPMCPVDALKEWLEAAHISEGPLFRPVPKGGAVLASRLSGNSVAAIVKQHVMAIGLDPSCFSGHSLRAGFATSAAAAGVPAWKIRAQTGHTSDAMLARYIREGRAVVRNAIGADLRACRYSARKIWKPTVGRFTCADGASSGEGPCPGSFGDALQCFGFPSAPHNGPTSLLSCATLLDPEDRASIWPCVRTRQRASEILLRGPWDVLPQ
jgi:hypothetical protein